MGLLRRLLPFLFLHACSGQTIIPEESTMDNQQELKFRGLDFEILVFPPNVTGLIGKQLNFTVTLACPPNNSSIKNCSGKIIHLEVNSPYFRFWTNNDDSSIQEYGLYLIDNIETTVFLNTSMIGIYDIQFYTILSDSNKEYLQKQEPSPGPGLLPAVISRLLPHNQVVGILLSVLLLVGLFLQGIEIDLHIILGHLRRPVGPAIGFVSQFLFMPLLSWGIGRLLLSNVYERLGLIIVGTSPGGFHSNLWTSLAGGDVNLSVTMTFLSTLASFGMTTFWIWLLNEEGQTIQIPYDQIAISLATLTIPLLAGTLFKHRQPILANRVGRLTYRPVALFILIIFPVTICVANDFFFYLMTWRHLLAGAVLGICGYLLGALLAIVCRQGVPQIIAVSLETTIQNPFVMLIIMTLSFPSPYCEMGLLSAFAYLFSISPVLLLIYVVHLVVRGCKKVIVLAKKMKEGVEDEKKKEDKMEREETVGHEMISSRVPTEMLA